MSISWIIPTVVCNMTSSTTPVTDNVVSATSATAIVPVATIVVTLIAFEVD